MSAPKLPTRTVFGLNVLFALHAGGGIAGQRADAASVEAQAEPVLEELVVTAQRREQRLQDVSISMSVLSARDLERRQLDDVESLQYAAPNLSVVRYAGNPTRANVAMRGQVEPDQFPTLDPAVGLYIDGVYVARIGGANLDLIDMERVEVLRGPQGTLFGRNSIGGVINLVPRKPGSEFESLVTLGTGNYDRRDLAATIDLPFASSEHAFRFAASHTEHSGYGRNTLLGEDLGAEDTSFARTQLRFTTSEHSQLDLSFDFTRNRSGGDLMTLLAAYPPLTQFPATRGNPNDRLDDYQQSTARNVQANRIGPAESEAWGASGTLEFDLAHFTLKAISAYRSLDATDRNTDLDATPYDLLTIFARDERQHQGSHELQAYHDSPSDRMGWIGGLYYFEERGTFEQRFQGVEPTTFLSVENQPRGDVSNESYAAYGQLTYAITPQLGITAGARYNEDRRQLTSRNARSTNGVEVCRLNPAVRDEAGVCRATLPERTFGYVPWTLGVDFRPSKDMLLYAKVSRGHRAGGYNMRGATEFDLDTFEPERVTAYEIGTHAQLAGDRLRLNLALFLSLFDDIQLRQAVSTPGDLLSVALTQNGGEARIRGGELEASGLLGVLRLTGSLGVIHPEYRNLEPNVLDVTRDSNFLHTPRTTASIAGDMPIAVNFGRIDLHADWSWRDDVPFAYDPRSPARQDAYGLFNAMLVARFDRVGLDLELWGRNLTDERYLVRAVDNGALVTSLPGDPRTYGVSLKQHFGAR